MLPAEQVQMNLTMVVEQEIPEAVLDTLTDSFYLIQQEAELNVFVNMVLQDTNQVSKINIKLGVSPDGSEFLNRSFFYDQINPGAGYSYARKGNYIKLGLGVHPNTTNALYYATVEIEDANGNKSTLTTANTSN